VAEEDIMSDMSSLQEAFGVFGEDDDGSDDDIKGAAPAVSARVSQARITVHISQDEKTNNNFTSPTVAAIVACLRTHGVVILQGAFDADAMTGLGEAAVADLEWALSAATELAKAAKSIGDGTRTLSHHDQVIYKELCCRQEGRFEVRGGPALTAALSSQAREAGPHLRTHPGILSVLRLACSAPGHELRVEEVCLALD
jgi:hypothetical protein